MYDYGNARLHAIKSRFLSRNELELLAEAESLQGLIAALTRTVYRTSVEIALTRATGMDCINEALRFELVTTLEKARRFYSNHAGELVSLVLHDYDIHNLKAILRGLARNASPGEILSSLLPIGDLSYSLLSELARASGPRGVIDLLASMNLPFAQPLLKLRARHPGAELFEMELALEQWHYQESHARLQERQDDNSLLLSALNLDADLDNLFTVLRLVNSPGERKQLRVRLGTDQISRLFVGPGNLSFDLLSQVSELDALETAVEALASTPYGIALRAGMDSFHRTGRLSDFEKQLKRFRLDWMTRLIRSDPLGIGVFLGFLALKVNEIDNIRWIALGIWSGMKAEGIKAGLELIS